MAHPSDHRMRNPGVLRWVLVLVGLFMVAYIVGRPIFWHLRNDDSYDHASCTSCDCDCDSDDIFSTLSGFLNSSNSDCGESVSDRNDAISDELEMQRNVTDNIMKRTQTSVMDSKKTSSHYQKEAEKCNAGMETCEGAREKAEAGLTEERKLTALWERRARELGWKDERRIYSNK